MSHADVLDEPERLRGAFWSSVLFHVSLAAVMLGYTFVKAGKPQQWGAPDGGGPGSVLVNPVSIPLPSRAGPTSPLANPTESRVPAPPTKSKPEPKAKTPEPDAIPIKGKKATRQERVAAITPKKQWIFENLPPNQLTTPGGRRMTTEQIGMPGGGGDQIGIRSPFGNQFGDYATHLRDQIARNWKTSDVDSRLTASPVTVLFTIRRDGSLAPGSVKVSATSGNRALDFSAQRAILDAAPFQPLPAQFTGSEAALELTFHLRQ